MHHITMHLDFVSPYAWLAFQQLPQSLAGLSYRVEYRPVLLGALLQRNGNPGPAGIAAKRVWTYRHAQWLGQHLGVALRIPASHPFNPLPLLRLALATSENGSINRYVAETVFRHVWESGQEALAPERLQALQEALQPQRKVASENQMTAKQWLHSNTEKAADSGVFGVPALEVEGKIFWGLDSLPMLRDFLHGSPCLQSEDWENAKSIPSGLA